MIQSLDRQVDQMPPVLGQQQRVVSDAEDTCVCVLARELGRQAEGCLVIDVPHVPKAIDDVYL